MSRDLLLDTHVLLWLADDDPRWRALLEDVIDDPASTITVSVVAYLEVAVKHAIGKLPAQAGEIRRVAGQAGLLELPVTGAHAEQLAALPLHHRDPFDRILAAQAMSEGMTLVTADASFDAYDGLALLGR